MDDKIKFYSNNEKSILDSVTATIYTTYEKTEAMKNEYNRKVNDLENRIKSLESDLICKTNDTEKLETNYHKSIDKLKDEINIKNSQLADLSNNNKMLQEYLKNNEKAIEELKKQINYYKTLVDNKDKYYAEKISKCSDTLINISEDKKKLSHEELSEKNELERVRIS